MKKSGIILLLFGIYCSSLVAIPQHRDSTEKLSIKYSKQEWKKEANDLKLFEKQIKEWNKACKKPNSDYLNTLYSRLMETVYKEHNELSTKISGRSKKMHPGSKMNAKDSLLEAEKPKAYNAELKDQPMRLSKSEIHRQKAESDYLNKYVSLVKAESNLLLKLKKMEAFTAETKAIIYAGISADLNDFKSFMKAELELMKPETAKK